MTAAETHDQEAGKADLVGRSGGLRLFRVLESATELSLSAIVVSRQ